jgi:hypothetical protein
MHAHERGKGVPESDRPMDYQEVWQDYAMHLLEVTSKVPYDPVDLFTTAGLRITGWPHFRGCNR